MEVFSLPDSILLSFIAAYKAKKINGSLTTLYGSGCLAGICISLGTIAAYTVGFLLRGLPFERIAMAAAFAVALSLVVHTGSDLFTGNILTMCCGLNNKSTTYKQTAWIWLCCWIFNFMGSVLTAGTFLATGLVSEEFAQYLADIAIIKTSATPFELLLRGILCNLLVCLAILCAAKAKSESGKLIMAFWCVFAFFVSGFEHSIANMTLFALVPSGIYEFLYNLIPVTIGNIIGGWALAAILHCKDSG